MTTRNSPAQPAHEDAQTIQKLLVDVIGLIDTFSADQRDAALLRFDDPRRLGRVRLSPLDPHHVERGHRLSSK